MAQYEYTLVIDTGWVAAADLVEGDEIYLLDGTVAYVTGSELEQLSETIKVYNLEVEDFNTYFVGDEAVLVHNYKKGDKLPDPNELANSDWQDVTHPQQAKNTNSREYYNAASDTKIRFDPAKPGAPGFEGQDHYHIYNPNSTGKGDFYLDINGNPVPKGSTASHILISVVRALLGGVE